MIAFFRVIAALALIYQAWIVFRVADQWIGAIAGAVSVLLLPISMPIFALLMFFIPVKGMGALALWPAAGLICGMEWVASKKGKTLLIK